MCPPTQEEVPGALYSPPKPPPPVAAVPSSSESPIVNTAPPPDYSSHNFDTPAPAPTTATSEGYRHDTESGASARLEWRTPTGPPRGKKNYCCLAIIITLLALGILSGILGLGTTIAKRKAPHLAYEEQFPPAASSTSSGESQSQAPEQTVIWAFGDLTDLLNLFTTNSR